MAGKTKFRALNEKRVIEGAQPLSKFDSILKPNTKTLKMKVGINTLRLVRGADEDYWGYELWCHNRVGTKSSTYLCLKLNKGTKSKTCPICQAADEAAANGDTEEAKALVAKQRTIAYVIDRDNEKDGLQVWDMSGGQRHDIDSVCSTVKHGVLDVSHAESGFDLTIRREGTGLNTRYVGLAVDRESTPLSESARQQDAWLAEVAKTPLGSLLRYYDADYLSGIISGKIEQKDEDDEDTDTDRKPAARGRGRDAEDTEDADDADERPRSRNRRDDDDDDNERPAARAKPNGRARTRDEDEDAPWEDEKAPPRRGSRARDDADEDDPEAGEAKRWRRSEQRGEEDDEPRKPAARGRGRDEEEEEERPRRGGSARGRSEDSDDDDDRGPPRRGGRARDDGDDGDERPARGSRRDRDEDEDEPRKPTRRASRDDEDEDEPRKPARTPPRRERMDDDDEGERRPRRQR